MESPKIDVTTTCPICKKDFTRKEHASACQYLNVLGLQVCPECDNNGIMLVGNNKVWENL